VAGDRQRAGIGPGSARDDQRSLHGGEAFLVGLDCEGNYIFAASNASGNEGALSVITSSP
jgi:hypothetical protein